jgi:Polyketide synthase modules and related proteins
MKHRIALLAESIDQAKKKLSAFISNPESHKIIKGCSKNNPKVAFLFAGMDLQYINA